jgi:SAM-dependent MidA family methyltransferase
VSDEAIQNARDMLKAEQAAYTAALPVLEGTVELFNKVNKEGAGVANELVDILKGMTDSEVKVSQEHNVKVEVDDQTKERLEGINNEVQTSNANQAQRDQNVDNLVGQLAQSDISIQELAGLIKEGKQVKIDFNMNAKQMANTLFDVYQAENGLLTVVPADQ